MSKTSSPYEDNPPPGRKILRSVVFAVIGALVLLLVLVLPAEYGIDPTGLGGALGLTALAPAPASRTFQVADVIGGNEGYKEVEVPDYGDPVPLPNPAVFQRKEEAPSSRSLTIVIPPEGQTEVKAVLDTAQVIVFSWRTDRGSVYVDFHGHEPEAGDDYWVRYEELDEGAGGQGSLVAPFAGEHGWFWLNYNDFPVQITLEVSGYYSELIDYGLF